MEEWKMINDFPNYQISNMGQIKNNKGKILKKHNNGTGYYQIGLYKNKKCEWFYIHRLVAIHFLPNWNDLKECDHINNDKSDNRYCNLRWITRSNNMKRIPKREGTINTYKGIIWDKSNKNWVVRTRVNGKRIYLGRYKTEEEAYTNYLLSTSSDTIGECP